MAIYTKRLLSESTNGKQIALLSLPTLIHTAAAGTSSLDEVCLYVSNIHTADVLLTLEWGGATSADQMIMTVPTKSGRYLVVDKKLLQNTLQIKGWGSVTDVLNIDGYVNRIEYG
jgi:hypothetical protein|tara:strand:- start:803 stop:1147 length:345 start_codon:yes stop_codon:yes gene_type:complete